jgi:hypothetical protein
VTTSRVNNKQLARAVARRDGRSVPQGQREHPRHRLLRPGPASVTIRPPWLPEPSEIDRLQVICERLSQKFRAVRIIARQACRRSRASTWLPAITSGGILNAPTTDEFLAELIADVARSTDLTPFDPMRLKPLDPSLLRSS